MLAVRALGAVAVFIALLVVELIVSMFLYGYLQLGHTDFFGFLVRQAGSLLALAGQTVQALFPDSANQIYATVFGELGPKSILLLLIGLVVGALFRTLIWSGARMMRDD